MANMAVSTHLQGSQVGDFVFFGFLLEHLVLLLWPIYIYHYLIWFHLCGYLVEIVRLFSAVEMRRNKVKLPLSLCSCICQDFHFQKEIVTCCTMGGDATHGAMR